MICLSREKGFTVIELVMVIVVLGIVSLFVVPRFNSQSSFDSLSFHQELKTAIRYAHKLSIASACDIQVVVTASSYSLFYPDSSCNPPDAFGSNPVSHPVQTTAYNGTAPTGVSITGFGNFYFNAMGSPSSSGTITVNPDSRQIKVNSLTGFVE